MEQYEKIDFYRRIVRAKLFIDNNYTDDIDLGNISGQAYFSKFHFIRLFKSIYGRTPNKYLGKVRIDKAKDLLTQGCSVLETCYMVGFDSPTTFASMFKRATGQSPSIYQSIQIEKRKAIQANPYLFVPNCFAESHGWIKPQF